MVRRGHRFGGGAPIGPGAPMVGAFIDESRWTPPAARWPDLDNGDRIEFFTYMPLHPEELKMCMNDRAAFLGHFADKNVSQLFDYDRPNSVPTEIKSGGFWSRWFGHA